MYNHFPCFQAALAEPVRPLLTAEALQTSGGDHLDKESCAGLKLGETPGVESASLNVNNLYAKYTLM